MTDDEIRDKINSVTWYHRFEIVPGVTTPGRAPVRPKEKLDRIGVPADLSGKTAIDIGAWDGPVTFELARRGAQVVAFDIQDPSKTGFNVAREILGFPDIEYIQGSVYDVDTLTGRQFDVVCFFGVYYHLKSPLLGFEAISRIMKEDSTLYFEGEVLTHSAETLDNSQRRFDDWILQAAESDVPLMLYYPGVYKTASNWAIPNVACVRGWMQASGLEMTCHQVDAKPDRQPWPYSRIHGAARKVATRWIEEHPRVG